MRTLCLVSDSPAPCGVEHFARTLAAALARSQGIANDTLALTGQPGEIDVMRRVLADRDWLVVNLPVVAWKRKLLAPPRAMAAARRMGRKVLLVLHEWADLDPKRRLAYLPLLPFADRILFSSPHVRQQFLASPIARLVTRDTGVIPIPPNLARPAILPETALSRRLGDARAAGTLVVATFGAIYPKKQPVAVLDILAELRRRGRDVLGAFIGDYVKGGSVDPQSKLTAAVTARGLDGAVLVTGFIGPADELFAAMSATSVLVYDFAEGLTSRRGSVLAALQSGRPVVVNAPHSPHEFDHHPTYRRAIAEGSVTLLDHGAGPGDFADAIAQAAGRDASASVDFDAAWSDAVACVTERN